MKSKVMKILVVFSVLVILSCASGGNTRTVARIDSRSQTDLSGYWNDTDARQVCESLIEDLLNSPRVNQAIAAKGGKTPVVLVGKFRNDSMEQIDTTIIASVMETVIFNTGKLDFVAGGAKREELRAERYDQQFQAAEDTAPELAKETGADFMLMGSIKSIEDRAGNQIVRKYIINCELTNIETNQRLWMGMNDDIKKYITQAKNRL